MDKKDVFEQMRVAIMEGRGEEASQIAASAAGKIDPLEIIDESMMPAMKTVGDRFGKGELFLPEMLEAAEAWNEAMKILKPKILEERPTDCKGRNRCHWDGSDGYPRNRKEHCGEHDDSIRIRDT